MSSNNVDDRVALNELYRIIAAGGLLIIMVPIIEGWCATFEDRSLQTEADRRLHFGQGDHMRYYGADIRQRITDSSFALSEFTAVEPFIVRHGLLRGEKVFLAHRPLVGR
jgi:hypothetical protein